MASMTDEENSTSGNHVNLPSFNDVESIFKVIHNFIGNNLKNAFYNIRKLLNKGKENSKFSSYRNFE